MNTKDVLKRLEALGTAQNRKVYARHGVTGPAFGVSYANLNELARELKGDQDLAEGLWKSGNHDARVLATMIADPERTRRATLQAWVKDLRSYVLTDALAGLAARTAAGPALARSWIRARGEWASTTGWATLSVLLANDAELDANELAGHLATIEETIHRAPNRTRYAMNNALISIGALGGHLQHRAVAAAKRIGPVEVDHGETGCKTPDAVSYIAKVVAHRKARGRKAAKRKKA
jgi:3-methyladenine DNA glycosylase AlkD